MSALATNPVYACRRCGKPVIAHLSTTVKDEDSSLIRELMKGLADIALCKYCRMAYNWYASQGRSDEFLLNPHIVIYNVIDPSGLDYYRRKG